MQLRKKLFIALIVGFETMSSFAYARIGIRDTEIERLLDSYTAPLTAAAGLDASSLTINVLNLPDINAFVADGQNIFIHAGLIMKIQSPDELMGVIAHEMGHVTGGHLVKRKDAEEKAFITSLVSSILIGGAGLALGNGNPQGAVGGIVGGQMTGLGKMLAYSRVQESAADQAALSILEKARLSPQGMLKMLSLLAEENGESVNRLPYATTHPLSRDRITLLEERAKQSTFWNSSVSNGRVKGFDRMRGKLKGFLSDPEEVLREYPVTNTSVEARYARAAAFHRTARHDNALSEVNALIQSAPSDPYFYELRGQFYMETGKVDEAIADYRQAYKRSHDAPLIASALGQALVQKENQASLLEATTLLKRALVDDPTFDVGWHALSIAYDRLGNTGQAALCSAEMFMAQNDTANAITQARRAKGILPKNSPEWYRANDLEDAMEIKMQEQKNHQ